MSFSRYLLHDFFTAREFNRRDEARRRQRRAARRRRTEQTTRMDELEDDLAELALFTRTLIEVVLRKNLLSREEFDAILTEVDQLDGEADGRLDPSEAAPPPELPPAD